MTKNEQIEEIATVIRNHSDKYDWNLFEFECKNLAIVLHNLGYRKIDDDCAVITKAELKQYKVQAVKEFAEKLKSGLLNCTGCYIPNCFESPTDEFAYSEKDLLKLIYELLKECEAEEWKKK